MTWFRPEKRENDLDALRSEFDQLRTRVADLSTLVLEQDTQIKLLRQERALREAELMDLRTRFETIIKRVQQRIARVEEPEEKPATTQLHDMIQRHRAGIR